MLCLPKCPKDQCFSHCSWPMWGRDKPAPFLHPLRLVVSCLDPTRRNQVSKDELKHLSSLGDSWGQQELC